MSDTTLISDHDDATRALFDAASEVRNRTYSPYSGYPVGAAVRTIAGDVFACCNVENAAYPLGTCAEAGAISMMVAASVVKPEIVEVVVVTGGDVAGTPCGGCRQRIREFATPATIIRSATLDGEVLSMTMDDLLPFSFGPERLL